MTKSRKSSVAIGAHEAAIRTRRAGRSGRNIRVYAEDNREAAARLVARIEEAAAKIAASPYVGEATRKSAFRRFPVGKYLIVYEVGSDEVVIHYVRHAARRRPWEGEE